MQAYSIYAFIQQLVTECPSRGSFANVTMTIHINFEVDVLHIKKKNLNLKAKQVDFLITVIISQ